LTLESLENRQLMTTVSASPAGPDYGDAPDGAPTGYPDGFADTGSFPSLNSSGGAVALDTTQALLGSTVTTEADSIQSGDDDDGIVNFALPLTSIPPTAVMTVEVSGPDGSAGGTYWINVLVDLNLDGQWNGVVGTGLNEWAVINYPVSIAAGATTRVDLPAFNFAVPPGNGLPDGAWMRIALTDSPIAPAAATWDGSGKFAAGEIEDHVILIPDLGDDPNEPKSFIPTVSDLPQKVFFRNGERSVVFGGRYSNIGTTAGTGGFDLDRINGGVQITRWTSNVFNQCRNNPQPDVTCTTVRMGARAFGRFEFEAVKGALPSPWAWRAYGIDPPAVILPHGVIVGFTESVGAIEFLEAPLGDTTGDGIVTWDDLVLVEEMLGQTAERTHLPPVLFTFDAPEEIAMAINSGSVGIDHDSPFAHPYKFDANVDDRAIMGTESLRILSDYSDAVLDSAWTSASEGTYPFTVGVFVSSEEGFEGTVRLFGANTLSDGWQVSLVDLGDGMVSLRATANGELEDMLEIVVPAESFECCTMYVALMYDGAGRASLHAFGNGNSLGSAEGPFGFRPTDASITLGAQPGHLPALPGVYDDFAIWDDTLDYSVMQKIAILGVDKSTTRYLEGDADANGVVDHDDLQLVRHALADLNADGKINELDIQVMGQALRSGEPGFDLNLDGMVDSSDWDTFIRDIVDANYGDANLDGVFDSADLVRVFQAGKYESPMDADWASGDWNGDGRFDTQDLVFAFQGGAYSADAHGLESAALKLRALTN
jgi:hypothetical protein